MGSGDTPAPDEVRGWLEQLGVDSLCAWDVLVFLDRHRSSLLGADQLGLLVGYATGEVVAALEALESGGLVRRSHPSAGARLYQLTAPQDPRPRDALGRLLALADRRAGRLLISAALPPRGGGGHQQTPPPSLTTMTGGRQGTRTWLKAI